MHNKPWDDFINVMNWSVGLCHSKRRWSKCSAAFRLLSPQANWKSVSHCQNHWSNCGLTANVWLLSVPVTIDSIHEVCEGKKSEMFRRYADNRFDPNCCFSIYFGRRVKSLDLVSNNAEEVRTWVTGLKYLMAGISDEDSLARRQRTRDQYPFLLSLHLCWFMELVNTTFIPVLTQIGLAHFHVMKALSWISKCQHHSSRKTCCKKLSLLDYFNYS